MVTKGLNFLGAALATALVLTSCTHEPKPETPAWDDNDHTTTRWIPNPAADLMSPEGTFIRAASESWWLAGHAQGTGIDAIRSGGYPGFEHALNFPSIPWKPEQIGGATRFSNPAVGTDYREIVSLTRDGERFRAGLCHYTSQVADHLPDNTYRNGGHTDTGTGVWLTFGPDPKLAPQEQHSPPPMQKGQAKKPTDNVFGTWVIFDYDPLTADSLPQCKKLAPGTPDNLPSPYIRNEPPPTLPPDPGWPTGSVA